MSTQCVACGGGLGADRVAKGTHEYAKCAGCGSASLVTGSPASVYNKGYFAGAKAGGYYDYQADETLHRATGAKRLAAVAAHAPATLRVADVGCALGYTLDEAVSRGWTEAVGVEVSDHAVAVAGGRGHRVLPDLDELETSAFDGVIFGQVLEHMPDPNAALAATSRVLKSGGVVFIETWDIESSTARRFGNRWQQISPPSVVHLFSSRGIRIMLERSGYEIIEITPWSKKVSVGGYLGVIAGKLPSWLGAPLMTIANVTRLSRIAITYRFDDLIAVVARKSGPPTPP